LVVYQEKGSLLVTPKRICALAAVSAAIVLAASCSSPSSSSSNSTGGSSPSASGGSASPAATGASASPTLSGSGARCVTSDAKGHCGPYPYAEITGSSGGDTYVLNNMWAPNSGTTQKLTAAGPGSWTVTANAGPAGNTSVQTYPDTQQLYTRTDNTPDPLSGFHSIISSFTETMPTAGGMSAEAAYDIWAGQSSSTNYADEIMIWNDQINRGTCGGATVRATASFGGSNGVPVQNWTLCDYHGSELIWYLTNSNERTGTVDVLAMLTWLETHHYLPAGTGLNQIDYGFEICATPGPQTFTVSQFSIKSS
jgi:hypothetical protein